MRLVSQKVSEMQSVLKGSHGCSQSWASYQKEAVNMLRIVAIINLKPQPGCTAPRSSRLIVSCTFNLGDCYYEI